MFQLFLLTILLVSIFTLPFIVKKAEDNLEVFLVLCGIVAITISDMWSGSLVWEALTSPLRIAGAVFLVGILFKHYHFLVRRVIHKTVDIVGLRVTLFLIVFILGSLASLTTAVVAALILSEVAAELSLTREQRTKLIIYTCFAISIGSILTPVAEPLGAIVIEKLSGPPHNAGTFYMVELLWPYILSALTFLGFLAYNIVGKETSRGLARLDAFHSVKDVITRTAKVYIFVISLVLIGRGLMPLAYKTVYFMPPQVLYWVNMLSATLDNSTLAAIEILPEMNNKVLTYLLMGLVLAGGMLVQGNLANILCASKFKIKSSEWAKLAVPLGLMLMATRFG